MKKGKKAINKKVTSKNLQKNKNNRKSPRQDISVTNLNNYF